MDRSMLKLRAVFFFLGFYKNFGISSSKIRVRIFFPSLSYFLGGGGSEKHFSLP